MARQESLKRIGLILGPLILIDALFFWLGLTRDAVTVGVTVKEEILGFQIRLVDDRRTYSIIDAIWKLKEDRNFGLFLFVGLFSVVFPVVKLLGNGWIYLRAVSESRGTAAWKATKRWAERLAMLSKWSMLEVFMAAMLCSLLKAGETVRLIIHSGMYWFLAAVVISIVNALLTKKLLAASQARSQVNMQGK